MIFKGIYEKKGRLGRGGFGDVFKVLNKNDNKLYALKGIPKKSGENEDNFMIKIMKVIV